MGFNCGIVGLPNVGKSTIFNALTSGVADAQNYPFCTIKPNVGVVAVPDSRLTVLAKIAKSEKIISTAVEFVDIAGLVKGASSGEGLGNQFLGHIRNVDAIVHIVRCFEDSNVAHVYGRVSPKEDIEIVETELMLADLAAIEKRYDKTFRSARMGDKEAKKELAFLEAAKQQLSSGMMLRHIDDYSANDIQHLGGILGLLTTKPVLYVGNVLEKDAQVMPSADCPLSYISELAKVARARNSDVIIISGAIEHEISQLPQEERQDFLKSIGLRESGLERLVVAGYQLLHLITFFTAGVKETRAWTCRDSTTAVDAAGIIHSDFARGFIRAEVISYNDYVQHNGEAGAREKGLMRLEGKTYQMNDGDIVEFRFNV